MTKIFPYLVLILALALFFAGNTAWFSRNIVDKISPCTQNPVNSFPCNGAYDLWLMVFAGVIGIVSVLFIVKGLIK